MKRRASAAPPGAVASLALFSHANDVTVQDVYVVITMVCAVIVLCAAAIRGVLVRLVGPVLSYRRDMGDADPDDAAARSLREHETDPGIVSTTLRNAGLGPAVIHRVTYDVRTRHGKRLVTSNIRDLVAFLRDACGAEDDTDYYLRHFTRGGAIPPDSSERIAALTLPLTRELALFRATYTCGGVGGWRRIVKTVDLIPVADDQRGLPRPPVAAATP